MAGDLPHGAEPNRQRQVAVLKNGSRRDRHLITAVVAEQMALERLNSHMVQWTALDSKRRIHVQTQGILSTEDWGNEMHPNRSGFEKEARAFYNTLQPYILK